MRERWMRWRGDGRSQGLLDHVGFQPTSEEISDDQPTNEEINKKEEK